MKPNYGYTRLFIGGALGAAILWGVLTQVSVAAIGPDGNELGSGNLGPTSGPAAEGRKVWLKFNCAGCHGGHDQGGMGPSIRHEADEISEAVLQGEGEGMPSYRGKITTQDINNLMAYLNTVGTPNEPMFTHWWESPPTR